MHHDAVPPKGPFSEAGVRADLRGHDPDFQYHIKTVSAGGRGILLVRTVKEGRLNAQAVLQ